MASSKRDILINFEGPDFVNALFLGNTTIAPIFSGICSAPTSVLFGLMNFAIVIFVTCEQVSMRYHAPLVSEFWTWAVGPWAQACSNVIQSFGVISLQLTVFRRVSQGVGAYCVNKKPLTMKRLDGFGSSSGKELLERRNLAIRKLGVDMMSQEITASEFYYIDSRGNS